MSNLNVNGLHNTFWYYKISDTQSHGLSCKAKRTNFASLQRPFICGRAAEKRRIYVGWPSVGEKAWRNTQFGIPYSTGANDGGNGAVVIMPDGRMWDGCGWVANAGRPSPCCAGAWSGFYRPTAMPQSVNQLFISRPSSVWIVMRVVGGWIPRVFGSVRQAVVPVFQKSWPLHRKIL